MCQASNTTKNTQPNSVLAMLRHSYFLFITMPCTCIYIVVVYAVGHKSDPCFRVSTMASLFPGVDAFFGVFKNREGMVHIACARTGGPRKLDIIILFIHYPDNLYTTFDRSLWKCDQLSIEKPVHAHVPGPFSS